MADDQDQPSQSGIPAWQRTSTDSTANAQKDDTGVEQPVAASTPTTDNTNTAAVTEEANSSVVEEDQMDVARRFLEDDEVKNASRDKKVAFLKAKGIEDGDIEKLLSETDQSSESVSSYSLFPSSPHHHYLCRIRY